jgi:hypothetical protein
MSVADGRGVYKWVSVNASVNASVSANGNKTRKATKGAGACYEIHDNYSVPYIVCIESSKKKLTIYKALPDDPNAQKPKMSRGDIIYSTHYRDVFIGSPKGNTVLGELGGGKYLYCGAEIYTFNVTAGDKIVAYKSPIGNNDFPYPVAVGEKNLYFMLMDDHSYVPRTLFDLKGDLYRQFYDMTLSAASGGKEAVVKPKKFAVKMIRKRWAK